MAVREMTYTPIPVTSSGPCEHDGEGVLILGTKLGRCSRCGVLLMLTAERPIPIALPMPSDRRMAAVLAKVGAHV